jgi:cytochrome c553
MCIAMTRLLTLKVLCILTIPCIAQDPNSAPSIATLLERGQKIYANQCASCHGERGEGVSGSYPDPLIGDSTISELTKTIDETMPEGEASECVADDARAVALYIHGAFYSEEAQRRLSPPKSSFSRLTAEQLRQSLADLYAKFDWRAGPSTERGVKGLYFAGDRWNKDHLKIERRDDTIQFDFGRESPGEGIEADSFYIYWEGALKVDRSGVYEIVMRSTCSFKMDFGKIGRLFIDNHVQSGDKTEFRERIYLVAGRSYPFKIDFIQRKRKTELPPAVVSLSWVPPGGVEEIIPKQNLLPSAGPGTFSLQAQLPPDDRTYGYERGISVNREWDQAVTSAAVEFADIVAKEIYPRYTKKKKEEKLEGRMVLKSMLREILDVAFRGSLSEEVAQVYVDKQVDQTEDDVEAIRRVMLLGLKSPRFLYPLLDSQSSRSQQAANRLSLILHDSLPSEEWLLKRIEKGELESTDQIRSAAGRMMADDRSTNKLRGLVLEWLNLSQSRDMAKDEKLYPGFDGALIQDLRSSLDAFINDCITSESADFRQLLTADWSYTTKRIEEFYGEAWKPMEDKPGLHRTAAGDPQRHGVLTHPYLMSRLAYHDTTSPIHRGIFLIRFVLGRTLRPPMDAFAPLSPDLHPDLTTRERVTLQTSPQNCQVCHLKINSLGFVLENYDAVGRYRDMERGKPVDTSGGYLSRQDSRVEFANAAELASYLATSPDTVQSFVNRAFQYFVKQPPAAFGLETSEKLAESFVASGYNMRRLIVDIAVIGSTPPAQSETSPPNTPPYQNEETQ